MWLAVYLPRSKKKKKKIIHKTRQYSVLCTLPPEKQAERSNVVLLSGYPDSFNTTSEKKNDYLCNVNMTEVTNL